MRKPLLLIAVFCVGMIAAMLPAVTQAQRLTVQLEAGAQKILTRAEIEALPRIKGSTSIHGTPATFEGVPLQAVWKKLEFNLASRFAAPGWLPACWWKLPMAIAW
ncbi:MAG: hypothetical protein WBV55_22665 [Candidatus Sulfotelmatobacter sp.]